MYDVYLKGRADLLVVAAGTALPRELRGPWRKKRTVRKVSDRIKRDIDRVGHHQRKLTGNAPHQLG